MVVIRARAEQAEVRRFREAEGYQSDFRYFTQIVDISQLVHRIAEKQDCPNGGQVTGHHSSKYGGEGHKKVTVVKISYLYLFSQFCTGSNNKCLSGTEGTEKGSEESGTEKTKAVAELEMIPMKITWACSGNII